MRHSIIAFSLSAVVMTAGCQKEVASTRLPNLCVQQEQWPKLITTMQRFAAARGLSFHGGIEPAPNGRRLFNAYVSRGYSFWFGDDFDLWIVSNPYRDGEMTYNALSKDPWSVGDVKIARALLIAVKPLHCRADLNGS